MKNISILVSLVISVMQSQALEWPVGQITFHVTDEAGKSLANVPVDTIVFDQSKPPATYKVVTSTTDIQGLAAVNTPNISKEYSYAVRNVAGYYLSGGLYKFDAPTNGQWLPWNPTVEIVLKPVGVQVPMYAKTIWSVPIPEDNKPIGYDLEIGDWLAPYGKGITSDFVFTSERKFTSITQAFDATLTLTFHNEGDGIQSVVSDSSGSSFRIPRSAPEGGYESKFIKRIYRETDAKPIVTETQTNQNYFFRVRTKKNDEDKIVSALYGKIYGDIEFWPNGKIRFQYYLNSQLNSRNMEFDPKQNLFKNLPPLERVSAP
jgi:hypothetical protein